MGSKKVVYLDVDGVLHPLRLEFKDGKLVDEHCFLQSCCTQLKRVVEATGAELVLSTSWRCYETSRERLAAGLAPYGLAFKRWVTTQELRGGRASQILRFVEEHSHELGNWAVVDDEDVVGAAGGPGGLMLQVLAQRFVRTDSDVGMQAEHADRLIALLNEEEEDKDEEEGAADGSLGQEELQETDGKGE